MHFRVDDRDGVRQFFCRIVVIRNDHIDPFCTGSGDCFRAVDTAVHSDQYAAGTAASIQSLLERFGGKSVSVVKSVREERTDNTAVIFEYPSQKRSSRDPVGVIITVDQDLLAIPEKRVILLACYQ